MLAALVVITMMGMTVAEAHKPSYANGHSTPAHVVRAQSKAICCNMGCHIDYSSSPVRSGRELVCSSQHERRSLWRGSVSSPLNAQRVSPGAHAGA